MNEIQKADPKARRCALLMLAGCAVICGTLLLIVQNYRAALVDWVQEDPALVLSRLRLVLAVVGVVLAAPLVAIAVYCWRFGRRVVQDRQFPSPGTPVIRDTPILRGVDATRRGRGMQAFALLLGVMACVLLGLLWMMAELFGGQ